ncbi:MAG: GNAT family N-acetyltransferase [Clostridiales bacterium]|nr:GNAT family N-acetyltransferase [Clostridiales bacterium]
MDSKAEKEACPGGKILRLDGHPELIAAAAKWFHEKWGIPERTYLESMEASAASPSGVPEWYVFRENGRICGGLGVIENDFHKRPDLRPNICAVYVEPEYRRRGIARQLLNAAAAGLAEHGTEDVYLITGHTDFYEKCGWEFWGTVEENDGGEARMYHRKTDSGF